MISALSKKKTNNVTSLKLYFIYLFFQRRSEKRRVDFNNKSSTATFTAAAV